LQRIEVRFAGFGGQGVILAGTVLGKAIVIYDGKNASLTQSYGPESRGGSCHCDLVVSDSKIDYPEILQEDYLIAMSQQAADQFVGKLRNNGALIVDSSMVTTTADHDRVSTYRIPATKIASEEFQEPMLANMIMLGAFVHLSGICTKGALVRAMSEIVPKRTVEKNTKALERGFGMVDSPALLPAG
jgi:2-oxoglutarate ferredoxin oxidoreductase subunit gamma